jgi:hypothetical protein
MQSRRADGAGEDLYGVVGELLSYWASKLDVEREAMASSSGPEVR